MTKITNDLHSSNLSMGDAILRFLSGDASDSEGSNYSIENIVGVNGTHEKLAFSSQDTDDSSVTSQEDSINRDSVSIMKTAENKSKEIEDRYVVKSDSLLPVEPAMGLLRSEQFVGGNIENESVFEDSPNISTEVKIDRNDGDNCISHHSLGMNAVERILTNSHEESGSEYNPALSLKKLVPINNITPSTTKITPKMLPLIDLTQADIDLIEKQVQGGIHNIKDIYALSPFQDGILFHHIMAEKGDTYLVITQMNFDNRELLDRYLNAFRRVVDRHDILRTAFIWEGLSTPAQVVLRQATLPVVELSLNPKSGPIADQMMKIFDPRCYSIELDQAPLIRYAISQDTDGRWIAVEIIHHIICDQFVFEKMKLEAKAFMYGFGESLPPSQPIRDFIAHVQSGPSIEDHKRFFTKMLEGVDSQALPFGASGTHASGVVTDESRHMLSRDLSEKLLFHSKRLKMRPARMCHLAWALVLSRISGQERVVFGTVVSVRARSGSAGDAFGPLINTLPICVDVRDAGVEEALYQVRDDISSLIEHEHATLALAQRCKSNHDSTPLISTLFNFRRSDIQWSSSLGNGIELLDKQELTNYPLTLTVDNRNLSFGLIIQSTGSINATRICGYMNKALESLLDALDNKPNMSVQQLEIMPYEERQILIETWNNIDGSYTEDHCVHQLFERRVEMSLNDTAVVYEDQSLTYQELNERANRLAHHLINLGVKPDSLVGICVSRSLSMIVAVMAVLKSGGAYVPLDPTFASERLYNILDDASPSILLADGAGRDALSSLALDTIKIVDPNILLDGPVHNPLVSGLTSRNLAYIIYTSGSTGKPKGVMIEHQAVTNLAVSRASVFGVDSHSRVLQFFSLSFDGSVHEIVSALCHGGSLYILPEYIRVDRSRLWDYLMDHSITHAILTPAIFHDCKDMPVLETPLNITLGGEALTFTLLKDLKRLIPNGSITNDYGPTETTVDAVWWRCPDDFNGDVAPIGRPHPNKRVYVLDSQQRPVPLGVVGELYISGIGVARGYLNRPDLTEKAFLSDPFCKTDGARMYKTGDLVRYLPDGNLIYLGRNDHQVKIRGFRIELGEIEARLMEHELVRETLVFTHGDGNNKRLIAYVVPDPCENLAHTLHEYLMTKLPEYMVPSGYVQMDRFPLTPNGKLDRRALPKPDINAFISQEYEAPRDGVESTLAAIWADLLKVDRVGRNDNFFMLGGHSLLAVQMTERLRRFGLELSVRSLFDNPTLSAQAQSLRGLTDADRVPENMITLSTTEITPDMLPLIDLTQDDINTIVGQVNGGVANIQDIYVLSPLQDGILFHHIMATIGDPYLLVSRMSFDNRDILDRFLDAYQKVVDRHDILRTAIMWENLSVPTQVVLRHVPILVSEISLDPANGSIEDQMKDMFDPRKYRMDLAQAPLLRFAIAQDVGGSWVVVQLMHHLIGDHSTLDILVHEIQLHMDGRSNLLLKPHPFRDLIYHARSSPSNGSHEEFFTRMLADIDSPALPYGMSEIHLDGCDITESHLTLPQDLNNRLRKHSKRMGVSLASICHLAWAQVISRTSGQEKVVFGTVLFGRMQGGAGAAQTMGLYINTLPFRVDVEGSSVEEAVYQTHNDLAALLEHEHASLALAQRCSNIPHGASLFNSILNYRHNRVQQDEGLGIAGVKTIDVQERTNYPFTMSIEDGGNTLGVTAQVVNPIDSAHVCRYMHQALESITAVLDNMSNVPVRQLEIMPSDEHHMLIETWNNINTIYSDNLCIHQLFEAQVEVSPDAIAIVYEDQSLSYQELNERANRLAHHLIDLGVKPDSLVGICVSRSLSMIVAVMAVLKSGGAYVPLDPTFASERLYNILDDASPAILLADNAGCDALSSLALDTIKIVDPNILLDGPVHNPLVPDLTSSNLAYIIYTSGSTGKPKGVMIEHQAVSNLAVSRASVFGVDSCSRVLQFFSLSFDGSVHEIVSALCHGGSLHILPEHTRVDRSRLWDYLMDQSITHAILTPAIFHDCKDMPVLETPLNITLGGDALTSSLLKDLKRLIPNGSITNDYGPTETTVDAVWWRCPDDFNGDVAPIGRPHPNKRVYVLDSQQRPVPLGVVGELYISGIGVARGYLNRPDLTEKAFLPDPFCKTDGARMYKTGDLVRYLPDGNLIYLGRNDHQVKIRGFRIELGEIEARLMEHELVRETLVFTHGDGNNKRLIAYVVADPCENLAHTLREYLMTKLPEYMVPSGYVQMDKFPLTLNGKLDRRALPEPDINAFISQEYEAPRDGVESTLAAIWADLLKVDRVGRNDNFFMLGGHSLLAVQMTERLRRFGLELSVRSLFDNPTLSAQAQSLRGLTDADRVPENMITLSTTEITLDMLPLIDLTQDDINTIVSQVDGGVVNIQDIYALSPLQDGILFHHIMATKGDPYLNISRMSFSNRNILDRFLDAFQKVVDRHDILRTAIMWENLSVPAQVVLRHAPLYITELSLDSSNGPIGDQIMKLFDPRGYRIDLTKAPLLRFAIAQDIDGSWIVIQLAHHLIGDNSTSKIMLDEIRAILGGSSETLLKPQQFRNLIYHARSSSANGSHEEFFTRMLADIDSPALPYGISEVHIDGCDITESHLTLPQDLNDRLRKHSKRMGVSLASMCHLAWAQVVSRTSGQEKVVFGTVLFGRMQGGAGAAQTMGLYINTLPFRVDVEGSSVEEAVYQTHNDLAALLEHEHASLAQAQRCSSALHGTPIFNSLLNYRHRENKPHDVLGIDGMEVIDIHDRTNYPFVISVDDRGSSLSLTAQTIESIEATRICGYMGKILESLATALDKEQKMQVRDLDIIPQEERQMLLEICNDINESYTKNLCIHQLFERQVEMSLNNTAVAYEGQSLTYQELNERANRLAHHLIDLGVKPDSLVAICVSRSIALIVSILAVLKAGGAYVPLDPAYASGRLQGILTDASPLILLADVHGRNVLGTSTPPFAVVVDPSLQFETSSMNPNIPNLTSSHLAYIIYTSGSTGKPKGVMVEHDQVTRLFDLTDTWYSFGKSDTWMLAHSYGFDFSVWELWGSLRYGGKLVIPSYDTIRSSEDMYQLICDQRVTVLNLTPSAFKPIIRIQSQSNQRDQLRYIILAGEALEPAILKPWYETRSETKPLVFNMYGPTETTVYGTYRRMSANDCNSTESSIGIRLPDVTTYVLDTHGQPVPLGVAGELWIGGAGVSRGYLNRPDLTEKLFLPDPFCKTDGARMYKTGDLVRYLPDGNLIYLGRNDHQVKIRGFRIETGEIEARLMEHELVREAAVFTHGDGSDKRLIAYVVADPCENLAHTLRECLMTKLPEYMVPSGYVQMDKFPLTLNGKLDRRALPEPDINAFISQEYEAPRDGTESTLAAIWADLLKVGKVGRNDNFFMLGGHSLLAVQMTERLRRFGLELSVRSLFDNPTLSAQAQSLRGLTDADRVPENMITLSTTEITPDMLPLIDLTQDDINTIVSQVDGGVANIQDIYALSPLQDGILFHHIMATNGDPYLNISRMSFDNRDILDRFLDAFQKVVDRHDILRTAIMWENLSVPTQVVLRHVPILVSELSLDPANGPIADQMKHMFDPRKYRIDLTKAPLLRFAIAQDIDGSWIVIQLAHHLIGDNSTSKIMLDEIRAILGGSSETLLKPQQFRNLIYHARSSSANGSHEEFFTQMLADIDSPALPYGISEVHIDGCDISGSHLTLPQDLNDRLRKHSKHMGVSLASMCHLAWAQVVSRTSGQEKVVFGTVLFGRMQGGAGAAQTMGLYINTLPFRVDIDASSIEEAIYQTHNDLAALLEHEHASLALAQRCSHIPHGGSLFNSIFNYRHNRVQQDEGLGIVGAKVIDFQERTNYPFAMSIEDGGNTLGVTAQVINPIESPLVCRYMHQALESIAAALDNMSNIPVRQLEIMPSDEHRMLIETWNSIDGSYTEDLCVHQLFERHVETSLNDTAVVYEDQSLTYQELNERANRLAHHLINLGVKPDSLVGICVSRSLSMIVAVMAVLKSGGAYVPLDPTFASERLYNILDDASPSILLADGAGRDALSSLALDTIKIVDPNILLDEPVHNPLVPDLTSSNLAYIIYTSGSTGKPKGVMIEHQAVSNLAVSRAPVFGVDSHSKVLQFFSLSFDGSVHEIVSALCNGGSLHILPEYIRVDRSRLWNYLQDHSITHIALTPAIFHDCKDMPILLMPLNIIIAGEALTSTLLKDLKRLIPNGTITNDYGPTETTVDAVGWRCPDDFNGDVAPIGRPLPNKRVYVLDSQQRPVPLGVVGELYISGIGVARGYLNRPDLTEKAFLPDPFCKTDGARMYKTGDLVRYLPDGNLIYLGRNDHQVKIRGFRIELGEIEARLMEHELVRETLVFTHGDGNNKRLIAYVVADPCENLAHTLREYLMTKLPEYMVPSGYVQMDKFPLTPNGKLDRRALPKPDINAFISQEYEAPRDGVESTLAAIWADLLKVDRVGRNDNFFMLGGHSLLAVQMTERLRRFGLELSVRSLFDNPTLSAQAQSLRGLTDADRVPENMITLSTTEITPDMLPLIDLTQDDINTIVSQVNGGVANIQDIYALSPLQDGILFHHIMATNGDPYLLITRMSFGCRDVLDRFLDAYQKVVDRHDILRTAIMWENLSVPTQVVLRHVPILVSELSLDPGNGPIADQMKDMFDPRKYRIDLTKAPLLRFAIAQDVDGSWIVVQLLHHLIGDHSTLNILVHEIQLLMDGRSELLLKPHPFRNLIYHARSSSTDGSHEEFFTRMLADIDSPALPYGISEAHLDARGVSESHLTLPQDLNNRLRKYSKSMGVSLASICHLAWAQVISRTSGQEKVVFGTVLFGRMQGGAGTDQTMGLYINTLPFRVDIDASSIEEAIHQTHNDLAALLEHEHASLALAQRCSNIPHGASLFNSILNYRHNRVQQDEGLGIAGVKVIDAQERTNYPFTMSIEDGDNILGVTAQVINPIDPAHVCQYMHQALEGVAAALDNMPNMPVRQLEIIPSDEHHMLIETWNNINTVYSDNLCIHQLFEAQVEISPDAIAIVYEDQSLSYQELNERANRLAHHLIHLGVKPDSLVGICVGRSLSMIVAVMAVLKSGGAYVPLDPTFASERLYNILDDASPAILLADNAGCDALSSLVLDTIKVVDPNILLDGPVHNPLVPDLTSSNLAYIIYTSGSTGKPKGVMIEHQAVSNLAVSRASVFGVDSHSRVLQFFSLSFDGSVHEIVSALCHGGSLHILPEHIRVDRSRLWDYLMDQSITHAILTPAIFHDCKDMPVLETPLNITLGGDALTSTLLKDLKRLIPNGSITNDYGPTETTVDAVWWRCPDDFNGDVAPIGRPHPNKRVYVLDSQQRPVPLGVVGELYISGIGVARGYLNRPDLTEKAFLPDPFCKTDGARMYKTGDLVRYLPDGNLIYLGRNDHQVKIRGFRIELGEIEARLMEHELVRETLVFTHGDGNDKRLIAYVVADPCENLAHTLRDYLMTKLPEYMVPSGYVQMDKFPLTLNGKLDRRALPEPDINAFISQEYEAPRDGVESTLAAIWADLLKVDRVGRNDNFFMLGGHSLLAVQMTERLRRFGLELSVRSLFDNPTLSAQAQSLRGLTDADRVPENMITLSTTEITPDMLPLIDLTQDDINTIVGQVNGGVANIQDIYALSPLQDGILFHHIMATIGDPYLLVSRMSFDNRDVLDRFLDAFQKVVDRHDILRTAIMWENLSAPTQVVLHHVPILISELSLDHANGSIDGQMKDMFDPRKYRIDLTKAPLLRFAIAQDADGSWIVVQLMHHLIGDHSTLDILVREIQLLMDGRGDLLFKPHPFRNLIYHTRSSSANGSHEQFFTRMLADIDSPALPYGISEVHLDGCGISDSRLTLPQDLNNRLRKYSKSMGVSLASMCHLAWAQVISRTSGQEKVVFGTVLFGRMQGGAGTDQTMGLYINTLPFRVDIDASSIEEAIHQTHNDLAALLEHEHASLALAQRCSNIPHGASLFSSILNYRHNRVQQDEGLGIAGAKFIDAQERTNYPFTMSIEDGDNTLGVTAQVIKPIDSALVCQYMHQALESIAAALDNMSNIPVRQLEIMPSDERHMLIETWNNINTVYSDNLCIHQLFEAQVEVSPDAIAIVYEDQSLSYQELNERANRLSHHLIDLGVKPDSLVGICVSRSLSMIVAVMAVLKSGGAYVPLDPTFASERLYNILDDASPSILLADGAGRDALSSLALDTIKVVDPNILLDEPAHNPLVPDLTSSNLAYIIYTSGSTGKPKGVMIEHQAVSNLAVSRAPVFGVDSHSKVLQFFSLSFDGSAHEIVSALCHGGSLHILPEHIRVDRSRLWNYLMDHSITHAILTPAIFHDCKDMPVLETPLNITLGGEALTSSLLKDLKRLIPNGSITNDYGPTETTVDAVWWRCPDDFNGDVAPIGRPHPNKRVYVLDSQQRPVPLGVVGELYISGIGVARGYLNRPDLTEKAFLPDPFCKTDGARMYKTGDLVRYLPDGNLIYLGRNDHQVKIRGFRIELGEIEARLMEHELVRETFVFTHGDGNDKRLIAYVVADPCENLAHTLREYLMTKLPEYMVPSGYVQMDKFPLTLNGKLDRRALPEPDINAFISQEYEAPRDGVESTLAAIWADLLKVDRVGRNDNFFKLGGHSLLAVRLVNEVSSKLGFNLSLQTLFEAPTISDVVPRMVRGEDQRSSFDVLLPLKPNGDRPPLFCIHPAGGLSWTYIGLSKHLHPEQPIYGLQSRGIDGKEEPATSVEAMVSDYIEQIRHIQPHGPYHLLGWSFGGTIAHSMAVQLERLGEEVALLGIMDSAAVFKEILDSQAETDVDIDIGKAFLDKHGTLSAEDTKTLWPSIQRDFNNSKRLLRDFSPSIFSGDILFFNATQSIIDPDGWIPFSLGKVEVHDIDCKHEDMDQPEPLAVIGNLLGLKLEESHARFVNCREE